MDGRMFDGMISALLIIGALAGVALCGVLWLLYWLFSHLSIAWV
jgi:hypothetical protein